MSAVGEKTKEILQVFSPVVQVKVKYSPAISHL